MAGIALLGALSYALYKSTKKDQQANSNAEINKEKNLEFKEQLNSTIKIKKAENLKSDNDKNKGNSQ